MFLFRLSRNDYNLEHSSVPSARARRRLERGVDTYSTYSDGDSDATEKGGFLRVSPSGWHLNPIEGHRGPAIGRDRKESPEEKKARKREAKQQKQARRVEKKATKEQFNAEMKSLKKKLPATEIKMKKL